MRYLGDNKAVVLGSEIRSITFPAEGAVVQSGELVFDEVLGAYVTSVLGLGGTERNQTGDTVDLWDIDAGTVTRLYSLFDVLDPLDGRSINSDQTVGGSFFHGCDNDILTEDWSHSNSIWQMQDGNFLVSHRHLDALTVIDPDTDQLIWRLGGPLSDFDFPDPADRFYHQHSAKELPNGNILLFDNGNLRPGPEGGLYSRALELELDMVNMTATKVWEYRHTPDLYAACCSNVTRLDNGNTLVVFGRAPGDTCCRMFTIVEADPDGNVVNVKMVTAPGKTIEYRVYPIDTINGEFEKPQAPPETVEGLMLWLEADAITGLSDGDPVGTWVDQSGSGRHATQPTGNERPTYRPNVVNGLPAVEFDGFTTSMNIASLPIPSDTTIFAVATNSAQVSSGSVFKPILAAGNGPYSSTGNGYGLAYRRLGIDGFNVILADGANSTSITDTGPSDGSIEVRTFSKSGTSGTLYRNGTNVGSAVFNRTSGFHTGSYAVGRDSSTAGRFYKGKIFEIIVYNRALSAAERATIESYLAGKYGPF